MCCSKGLKRLCLAIWLLAAAGCAAASNSHPQAPTGNESAAPAGAAEEKRTDQQDYIIGPGDVLQISVWKDDALTQNLLVLPDGKFDFPLIGQIIAQGMTVPELKAVLKEKIDPYVPEPIISVIVQDTRSMVIYVIGNVLRPGPFNLNENIHVLKALSMAGGFNDFAKKDKVKIFRDQAEGTKILNFDYNEVVKGKDLEQNIRLEKGDVIVVP